MATFAVLSLKGGVGKTTVSINLGAALSRENKRVLLVDMDPQCGLTESLGYMPLELKGVEFLLERDLTFTDVALRYHTNLHVVPAGRKLRHLELALANIISKSKDSYFYYLLKNALAPVQKYYDFIIIDCPPTAGFLTVNALTCADMVMVPAQCHHLGFEASKKTIAFIQKIRRFNNPDLKTFGVIPTMYDRRNRLSSMLLNRLEQTFNGLLIDTTIRVNVSLAEAPAFGQPIFDYSPYSRGAEDFRALAAEVIRKLAAASIPV